MYKSPITVLESFMDDIMEQREGKIVAIVQSKIDVDVDKDELVRALQYDRDQYNAGYKDGKSDAMRWVCAADELPQGRGEVCKNVILHMDSGEVTVGWINESTGKVYRLDSWDDCIIREPMSRVKHWMPLPELPEVTE